MNKRQPLRPAARARPRHPGRRGVLHRPAGSRTSPLPM